MVTHYSSRGKKSFKLFNKPKNISIGTYHDPDPDHGITTRENNISTLAEEIFTLTKP